MPRDNRTPQCLKNQIAGWLRTKQQPLNTIRRRVKNAQTEIKRSPSKHVIEPAQNGYSETENADTQKPKQPPKTLPEK